MRHLFVQITTWVSEMAGTPWASMLALRVILLWAISGPIFGFSEAWESHINTITAIVTFLMVFLVQNAQNRHTRAIQLTLNELLRAVEGAHTPEFLDLEKRDESELKEVEQRLKDDCEREIEAVADEAATEAAERAADRVERRVA